MKFKKTPLFGQDSSPQNTSNILALCGTFLFWLIFVICMIFIKPNSQKPKYKEIQIILTQDFVAEKSDKNQESEKSQIQKTQESKLQNEQQIQEQTAKVEEIIKTEQTPKIAEQKQETPPEPVDYAKSVEELMAEQFKPKAQTDEFNWEFFDEPSVEEEPQNSPQNSQPTVENVQSSFSGSAGKTVQASNPVISEFKKDDIQQKTSDETSTALRNIANPNSANNSAKNKSQLQPENKSETESNDDNIEWKGGKKRKLLNPSEIELTSDAQSTIDNNLSVTITFTVTESGNVLPNSIKITPASMLSELVREQIIDQISVWRFEPADSVAVAEVKHNIVKK